MAKPQSNQDKDHKQPDNTDEYYQTPWAVIDLALGMLPPGLGRRKDLSHTPISILDMGCGDDARWGWKAKDLYSIRGEGQPAPILHTIEKRVLLDPPAHSDLHWHGDALLFEYPMPARYDLIVSNPPFSVGCDFVLKALTLLRPRGFAVFLLPSNFAATIDRYQRLHSRVPLWGRGVLVQRSKYTNSKLEGTKSKDRDDDIFVWRKGYTGETKHRFLAAAQLEPAGWQESLL